MTSRRGQILPLALVMALLLALFWILLLNIGKLIKDRVQMQIAADTAVQTACAYRARGLNIVGVLNSWLGTPVAGIGTPLASWWPAPPHAMGAGVIRQSANDIKKTIEEIKKYASGKEIDGAQALLDGVLRMAMGFISLCYDTHPAEKPNVAEKQQHFIERIIEVQENYIKTYGGGWANAKAREIAKEQGADDIFIPRGSLSLRLNRNKGPIAYLSTLHVWYAPWPKVPILTVPFVPANDVNDQDKRWCEQSLTFYRQSVRLYAFRRPNSQFNGSFPLGRSIFNVHMPYLYTVASARVYNPQGPMFPTAVETQRLGGGILALLDYKKASEGWHTQLVPVGGPYAH